MKHNEGIHYDTTSLAFLYLLPTSTTLSAERPTLILDHFQNLLTSPRTTISPSPWGLLVTEEPHTNFSPRNFVGFSDQRLGNIKSDLYSVECRKRTERLQAMYRSYVFILVSLYSLDRNR
jgi:hypothetical protein